MAPGARYESEDVDASALGQPLHFAFSGRSSPNRFLKAAMTERLSSWDPQTFETRGIPSKQLINLYKRWGEGGLGLILTGNIMLDYDQLEAAGNPIIPPGAAFEGERFESFSELAKNAKANGSLIVGQVSHPGRQVDERIQRDPISASDVQVKGSAMGMSFAKPHAASEQEIAEIVRNFAHAAEYLEKAGFDGIELHGAHGYLLAQFLSQSTNRRTDRYGGSIPNRARIILEAAAAIRQRVGKSFIISIKLNSVEFQDSKGFGPDEAKEVCILLEENDFDFIELSGGTYEKFAFTHQRESTKKREAFFLEFADTIAPALNKTRVYITGGFKTVGAMVDSLAVIDGVGLGRTVCQEPHLCRDILEGKVKGAIKQRLDQNDTSTTIIAAGSQILQVGKDQEPIDLSKEENEKAFTKDLGTWAQAMAEDTEMRNYGFVPITSIKSVPYGTAVA